MADSTFLHLSGIVVQLKTSYIIAGVLVLWTPDYSLVPDTLDYLCKAIHLVNGIIL